MNRLSQAFDDAATWALWKVMLINRVYHRVNDAFPSPWMQVITKAVATFDVIVRRR